MRYYTVEEANQAIPLLKDTFEELKGLAQQADEEQHEMLGLLRHSKRNGHTSSESEIQEKRRHVEKATEEMNRLLKQVTDMGIEIKDVQRGLVDFASFRMGRVVYLCWLLGEDEVRHWHETDAGFSGRQPI